MKNYIPWLLLIVAVIVILLQRQKNDEPIPVKVPLIIPQIKGTINPPQPILSPPIKVVEKIIHREVIDSIPKLIDDSVVVFDRSYRQDFEDDNLSVTVNSTVRGSLLNQNIDYTIKQKNIDTTILVTYPNINNLYFGISAGTNIINPTQVDAQTDLLFGLKNGDLISLTGTLRGNLLIGYKFKL